GVAQADRKACRQRRSCGHDLQANLHLEILGCNRLIDRQRKPIVMRVSADVLDRNALGSRRITHQRPLSEIASSGALKVEVGWRGSDRALCEIDCGCGVLGCKSAACQRRGHAGDGHTPRNKSGGAAAHDSAPVTWSSNPALQHPISVGIIPTLRRKIATMAATDRTSAHRLTLLNLGASNDSGNRRIGSTSRNTVWIANQ